MRLAAAALVLALTALAVTAHAEEPAHPSTEPKSEGGSLRPLGIGLTGAALVFGGVGTYFLLKANENDDATAGKVAIASYGLGVGSLAVGIPLWITGGPKRSASAATSTCVFVSSREVAIRGSF